MIHMRMYSILYIFIYVSWIHINLLLLLLFPTLERNLSHIELTCVSGHCNSGTHCHCYVLPLLSKTCGVSICGRLVWVSRSFGSMMNQSYLNWWGFRSNSKVTVTVAVKRESHVFCLNNFFGQFDVSKYLGTISSMCMPIFISRCLPYHQFSVISRSHRFLVSESRSPARKNTGRPEKGEEVNEVKKTKVLMLLMKTLGRWSLISNRNRSTNCHVKTLVKNCGVVFLKLILLWFKMIHQQIRYVFWKKHSPICGLLLQHMLKALPYGEDETMIQRMMIAPKKIMQCVRW